MGRRSDKPRSKFQSLGIYQMMFEILSGEKSEFNPTYKTFIELCKIIDDNESMGKSRLALQNLDMMLDKLYNLIVLMRKETAKSKNENQYYFWYKLVHSKR